MSGVRFAAAITAITSAMFASGCGSSFIPAPGYGAPPGHGAPSGHAAPAGGGAEAASFEHGIASFYSDHLAGRRTAAGEPYDPVALTAAHRTLPFGTMVSVIRADGRSVDVRINDRGPRKEGRIIDLSRRAAEAIGLVREGVAEVWLRVLSAPPAR